MSARRSIALLLSAFALLGAGNAAAAPPPSAAETVAECTRQSGRLIVDVQIDSSRSLQSSDPEDRRVDGISGALRGLADPVDRPKWEGPPPRAEVLLSSFAGSVQPTHTADAWEPVTDDTLGGLLKKADLYGTRDSGRDTDYVLALKAARAALNQHSAAVVGAGGAKPCKVILFLSDGGFHIGDRTGAEHLPSSVFYAPDLNLEAAGAGARAVREGEHYLCDRNGLMDKIAADGTAVFTVALTGPKLSGRDLNRLEAMTIGEGGSARCGSRLSEETGKFIEARDSTELFLIFRGLLDPGSVLCPDGCPNPSQFQTEAGMRGFVLATSPEPGVELKLTSPTNESETFSGAGSETIHLGGAEIRQTWIRGRSLELRAEFDRHDQSWLGTWRFQFYAPGETPVPTYDLAILSGLRPVTGEVPPLLPGRTVKVRVHLVDQLGAPASRGLAGSAHLHVSVIDPSGAGRSASVEDTGPGRFEVPVRIPPEASIGDWELRGETFFTDHRPRVEESTVSLDLGETATPGEPEPPWALVAAAVLLILLAVLLLDFRYRAAQGRFTRLERLRFFSANAVLTPGGAVHLDPDPEELDFNDFNYVAPGRKDKATSIEVKPFKLEAHVPRRFRGKPVAEASAGGRLLLGGRADGTVFSGDDRRRCLVPLDLAGSWLFAFEPPSAEAETRGWLILFADQRTSDEASSALHKAAKRALEKQDWSEFREESEAGEEEPLFDLEGMDWESIGKGHDGAQ